VENEFDIAVVGLSCRFPGARSPEEFWRNLSAGIESITQFSDSDLLQSGISQSVLDKPSYVKAAPVLEDPGSFDATFFGFTPAEARAMDPQHRILLELAHEALENAGCNPDSHSGRIGVFTGCAMNTYFINSGMSQHFAEDYIPTLVVNDKDFLSTRISYKLNLKGPSITIQTACSTSLVAVHLARQSLLSGETDLALAGAISVRVPHRVGYFCDSGGVVSPDGKVRAFDAGANGTVFGSGGGVIVLKRLADAIANRDTIYAVIKGSAVNNDGAEKAGYTAPSVNSQADAVVEALANAGLSADDISYVEAHGSGTPVGDPIEVLALTKAFRTFTQRTNFCALGSVKTNIGHLDAAAGMAGLIKTVLALRHRMLPPSLHYREANPEIDFPSTPFYVNSQRTDWKNEGLRRAGVMATGMGGTNAHVILEEAPRQVPAAHAHPPHLLVLSAQTASGLDQATTLLGDFLKSESEINLDDVARTLQVGRRVHPFRRFVISRDREDAIAALAPSGANRQVSSSADETKRRPLVFLLPGVGEQYVGMGAGLYERGGVFRDEVDRCARLLQPLLGIDIREVLFPRSGRWRESADGKGINLKKMLGKDAGVPEDEESRRLNETLYSQPALFTIEYALARMWMDLGAIPDAIVGHSMGEYVAACLARVFSLEDALRLITRRAQVVNALPQGAMLAVPLSEKEILPLLQPELSISLINGPNLCVVAGPNVAMAAFEEKLKAREINYRPVKNAHAFHSRTLEPIVPEFEKEVRRATLREPEIPYASNVSGTWITKDQATDPSSWTRHATHTARFNDVLHAVWQYKDPVLLEIGPGKVLGAMAMQHPDRSGAGCPVVIASLRSHYENVADADVFVQALGRLWLSRVSIDFAKLPREGPPNLIALPTYPFERRRHWMEDPWRTGPSPEPAATSEAGPLLPAPETVAPLAQSSAVSSQMEAVPNSFVGNEPSERGSRRIRIAARLRTLIRELSGVEMASDTATFVEMGFESLFLTQASQLFQSKFGVKVSFRQMLDDLSSVAELARYLDEHMPADRVEPTAAATPAAPLTNPAVDPNALRVVRQPPGTGATEGAMSQAMKRFGPYTLPEKGEKGGLRARQQKALDQLIERYLKKTVASKRYTAEHRSHLADPRAVAGFKSNWKEMVYPLVSARSKGSRLWDIDGNEYVDVTMGFGIYLFGHSPDWLVTALQDQLQSDIAIGPQSPLAGKVAKLITEFTGLERVTFCNTGSEAVMAAIRLARMVTGRKRVVFFTGDYHGMFEEVLVRGSWENGQYRAHAAAPGIPSNLVENMLVLEYGAQESLDIIGEHGSEIAAVLVEPVRSRQPGFQPRPFMHALRTVTEQAGSALIFDEMVTGFRCHPGGAQAYFGVKADMATYGKVLGGGIPIGILAGNRKFMDGLDGGAWNYGDDSFPEVGVTFFAGTFVRHPLAMTAAWQVLNHLKDEGPRLQLELAERVGRVCRTLNEHFERIQVPIRLPHFSACAMIEHAPELQFVSLLWYYLREKGIHAWEGRTWYFTKAHTDEDYDLIIRAFKESVAEMQEGGFLPETPGAMVSVAGVRAAGPEFPRCDSAPVTEAQREMLLAAVMDPRANCAYNQSCTIDFRGALDTSALDRSVQHLFDRHASLRSTFTADLETQLFRPSRLEQIATFDLSTLPENERDRQFEEFVEHEVTTPFDLKHGPLVRITLFKLSSESHRLVLTAHHAICDGWSSTLLIYDLSRTYNALAAGCVPLLPPPDSFPEFAREQARERNDAEYQTTEEFWLKQFKDDCAPLNLPTDRPRTAVRSYGGNVANRMIDSELFGLLKRATPQLGGTIFATLFGAYVALLHRLTAQTDIVIGVPAAGQAVLGRNDLVGHCVNFLPIRVHFSGEQSFAEFARSVKCTILNAYDHQNYTYGTLVRSLRKLARVGGQPPLVSAMFNIDKSGFDTFGFDGLQYSVSYNPKRHVNFDLFFNLIQTETSLKVECEYNSDLFDRMTIECWLEHFETLLAAAVADAGTPVGALPLLSKSEERTILTTWNNTSALYPRDRTWLDLFAEQVARTPDAPALESGRDLLSYRELDRRSNQLAHHLRKLGVGPNMLVALSIARSVEMVVGLLGILKAGSAYVPIDPSYPHDRRAFMLKDAEATVLLTQEQLLSGLPALALKVVCVDRDSKAIAQEPDTAPAHSAGPEDLAYMIYTSGSTGKPKGVQIEHRSLINFLCSMRREPGLAADDVVLAVTTLSFDIAGLELCLPLITGAKIVLASREVAVDGAALLREIERHRITVLQATPSTWRLMLAAGWKGSPRLKALCGGEALPVDLAAEILPRCSELWNLYGPTEATVWSTCARITVADQVHIGRPIANTEIYILDASGRPLPVGLVGELLIGGDGLARGYRNDPELTAEKFSAHPFRRGERIYRTGDLARWRPDGSIDCLGRRDFQVKIRGYRIELGEIEAELGLHPQVAFNVVAAREDAPGDKRLVAYVVARRHGEKPEMAALREHLRRKLPDYVVPSVFVVLDSFPLTPNGKIDRRALPQPNGTHIAVANKFLPPRDSVERMLAHLWSKVLRMKRIGLNDNFFELGGHSLLAVRIMFEIEKVFGKRLPLATLLEAPTIRQLARIISSGNVCSLSSSLVAIQPSGTKPPLFCVPGYKGELFFCRNLSRSLGSDQPVFGLRPQGVGGESSHYSIEEMAAHYLKEIKTVQATGPYFLSGYCWGGMVAYEMARLLKKQGEKVALLALFTAPTPDGLRDWPLGRAYLQKRITYELRKLRSLPIQKKLVVIAKKASWLSYHVAGILKTALWRLLPQSPSGKRGRNQRFLNVANINILAARTYQPGPYPGRITFFSTAELYWLYSIDPKAAWMKLAEDGIEFYEVAGDHNSMFDPPHVDALAAELRLCLARTNDPAEEFHHDAVAAANLVPI